MPLLSLSLARAGFVHFFLAISYCFNFRFFFLNKYFIVNCCLEEKRTYSLQDLCQLDTFLGVYTSRNGKMRLN